MAVKRCPTCGDLYLVAVERCETCDVVLVEVEEAPRPRGVSGPDGPGVPTEHERHELHEWTMEGRRLLDGMLHRAGIPRSWQGTTLLTPGPERERVEEMVALVAEGDARVGREEGDAEGGADGGDADGDAEGEVGYDLTGWSDLARGDLVAALAEAEIEHGWDADGDLVVASEDEGRVDAIFERLTTEGTAAGDLLADDETEAEDGLLVQETLSDLFVGADRLSRNALDGAAGQLVLDARDRVRSLRVPFGFERLQWQGILGATDELAAEIEEPTRDTDAIGALASALRARLREVV